MATIDEIYDADELREETDGDLGLLRELVDSFDRDIAKRFVRLREAIQSANHDQVRREGHAIKGGTALFYARAASKTAESIQLMGESGDLSDALTMVDRLESDVRLLRAELDKLFED